MPERCLAYSAEIISGAIFVSSALPPAPLPSGPKAEISSSPFCCMALTAALISLRRADSSLQSAVI